MCGNDRDVMSIRNTFLVRDSIREVARNMIIYISRMHRCTASVGLAKARPNYLDTYSVCVYSVMYS